MDETSVAQSQNESEGFEASLREILSESYEGAQDRCLKCGSINEIADHALQNLNLAIEAISAWKKGDLSSDSTLFVIGWLFHHPRITEQDIEWAKSVIDSHPEWNKRVALNPKP